METDTQLAQKKIAIPFLRIEIRYGNDPGDHLDQRPRKRAARGVLIEHGHFR